MASTYLVLINNVLRDLNEVELTSSTFSSSRGIQTSVKDFVNSGITDIVNSELNWPFTRAGGTLDLVSGKQLYAYAIIPINIINKINAQVSSLYFSTVLYFINLFILSFLLM